MVFCMLLGGRELKPPSRYSHEYRTSGPIRGVNIGAEGGKTEWMEKVEQMVLRDWNVGMDGVEYGWMISI